jgi:hypothetical protein
MAPDLTPPVLCLIFHSKLGPALLLKAAGLMCRRIPFLFLIFRDGRTERNTTWLLTSADFVGSATTKTQLIMKKPVMMKLEDPARMTRSVVALPTDGAN